MKPQVLHLSADFPDPFEPGKTPVIRSFLDLTCDEFDHQVISLNRVPPGIGRIASLLLSRSSDVIAASTDFEYGRALQYSAPARGLFHRTMLERLGEALARQIRSQSQPPDLLMAHKLTVEGIAVAKAAEILGLPYSLTIQGNTDRKILTARPDLRGLFRSIYHGARTVFTFSPVAKYAIEGALGVRAAPIRLIPCPTELDEALAPSVSGGDVVSVFHLKNHKVKNLDGLSKAAALMGEPERQRPIAIIGGGSEADVARCKAITASAQQIRFEGSLDRASMQARMNAACALVVPSRAESFGLVFVEALFAGLPIIYPKDTAVDGYFDGLAFAQRVDAKSPEAVAQAIRRAIRDEASMKAALAEWQQSPEALRFTRPAIAETFAAGLRDALNVSA